jgi:hypothetical protein
VTNIEGDQNIIDPKLIAEVIKHTLHNSVELYAVLVSGLISNDNTGRVVRIVAITTRGMARPKAATAAA